MLGLDIRTPNYIVIEETKVRELGMEAVKRAMKYEETARNPEKKIVLECWKEIDRRRKEEENKWEKKRREVMEKVGWSKVIGETMREFMRPEEIAEEMMEKLEEERKEKRKRHIEESRYNEEYKDIRTEERPGYLKGKRKKIERNRIARYRCGNEMRGSRYWREIEERECRICKEGIEDWNHILKECEETKDKIEIKELLEENGRGYKVIKKIEIAREKKRKEEEEGKRETAEEEMRRETEGRRK